MKIKQIKWKKSKRSRTGTAVNRMMASVLFRFFSLTLGDFILNVFQYKYNWFYCMYVCIHLRWKAESIENRQKSIRYLLRHHHCCWFWSNAIRSYLSRWLQHGSSPASCSSSSTAWSGISNRLLKSARPSWQRPSSFGVPMWRCCRDC